MTDQASEKDMANELIDKAIEHYDFILDGVENKETAKKMLSLLFKGASLGDLVGLDPDKLEVLYAYAYNLYNSGQYENAEKIFRALVVYDATVSKYWIGLAACRENQKSYVEAAELYAMGATMTGLDDPAPLYYSALCRLKADQKNIAIDALEFLALVGKENKPQDVEIKAKAKSLLETLKKNG